MKILSLFTALLFSTILCAQNISGKAYYESKTTVDMDALGGDRNMTEDMKKMIAERMKSMLEKTYILTFNNNESIYKEEEKLEAGAGSGGFGMMMGSFSPGPQYKNLSENKLVEEREFFGKQFLVTDTVAKLNWEIEKESKQIGQYIAFKATALKTIDANDYSMARPKRKAADADAEGKGDAKKKQLNDPMDNIEIPKEVLVTAWFTPQIPVGNGPADYAGLPGLILELNVHRTTILCSKITMNPKDADAIEAPKKGDKVSREEFNKIVKDKVEEMRENFQGRGNGRRGSGFGG